MNLYRIQEEAVAFKHLRSFLDTEHGKIHDRMMKMEQSLRKKYLSLKQLESKRDPKALALKKELDDAAIKIEHSIQDAKEKLHQKLAKKRDTLQTRLDKTINDIASQHAFDLILNTNLNSENNIVLFAKQTMNITDEVIIRLNNYED